MAAGFDLDAGFFLHRLYGIFIILTTSSFEAFENYNIDESPR